MPSVGLPRNLPKLLDAFKGFLEDLFVGLVLSYLLVELLRQVRHFVLKDSHTLDRVLQGVNKLYKDQFG